MSQEWFYVLGGEKRGPFNEGDLRSKLLRGELQFDVLVWKEGMSGWKKAQDVREFQNIERTLPKAVIPARKEVVVEEKVSEQSPQQNNPATPDGAEAGSGGAAIGHSGDMPVSQASREVPSYLLHSIFCTLLCCLPFGIVGIVYASKVDSYVKMGKMDEAREASDKAKMWCILSFGSSLVIGLLCFFVSSIQRV